jgi:hypothetical protein
MNERFEIERQINAHREVLIERCQKFVDSTRIYEPNGLTSTQIHNLLQAALDARQIGDIKQFIEKQMERSFPQDHQAVSVAKGKAWKVGWEKHGEKESGQWFGERLWTELQEVAEFAEYIVDGSRIPYGFQREDFQREVELQLLREFLTWFVWYVTHCRRER